MSFVVRPARASDLESLYDMAKLTGGGFTNLPPDRQALTAKLERSAAAFDKQQDVPGDDLYLLVLENVATRKIAGTAQLFGQVGQQWPFYSYRIGTMSQTSRELGRTFKAEILSLTTDYEGYSEVGGLFLHPRERAGGLGLLLARSRYLFIRQHRARFGPRVLAELRGVIDEAGGSPFWDGLGAKFFGMGFQEADEFNARQGNQFIADLMPKHPIYIAMLPESARAVIGLPHPSGRAAMRMLENEGFAHEGYIDIFDGGPTMAATIDQLKSVREATEATIGSVDAEENGKVIAAAGRLADFRAAYATVTGAGTVAIDPGGAKLLEAGLGDQVVYVGR